MVDRCKHCGRPEWTEAAEDLVAVCFCPGDANCELACRVDELVSAARVVVAADTYPIPGKTRFEATSEAIARLESLLPDLPPACAQVGPGEAKHG